ncbi:MULTISPECIES: DUF2231 domain-containing protein [Leptospira]|uniref:DUF2231 domain-containing protein n=1 Tax=Leptospira TaxID=171 RepID=UPI00214B7389|nr:DUF2231 domain-containing protein [Leptospira sp. id769339]MCR1795695.1 hypothetical protein [Leptospira sp. id769339]
MNFFHLLLAHGNGHDLKVLPESTRLINHNLIVLHPMIVHLPIGLLVTATLFEFLGLIVPKLKLNQTAYNIYIFGFFTALIALVSGFLSDNLLGHGYRGHNIAHEHKNLMIIATIIWGFGTIIVWKMKTKLNEWTISFFIIYLITASIFTLGANLGGELVYQFGVGVGSSQK